MFSRPRLARSREQAVLRNTTRAKIIARESQGSPLLTPFNAKPLNDIKRVYVLHGSNVYCIVELLLCDNIKNLSANYMDALSIPALIDYYGTTILC